MSKALDDFMSGKISIDEYRNLVEDDPEIKQELRTLIPEELRNPDHPYWKKDSYRYYAKYDFDLYELNKWEEYEMHTRGRIDYFGDSLNYYGVIEGFFHYLYPEKSVTDKYHIQFNMCLNICGDTYEGLEVTPVINDILKAALKEKKKTKQIQVGKALIKEAFHTEDGKRPKWIQGGDWPMGKNSPMKYIGNKHYSEMVDYFFVDVDTGEKRTVRQYF